MHQFEHLFEDLLILEFASALAGPLAGTFLKELGARVIKIEPPDGDVTRKWRTVAEMDQASESYYYCAANGNKEHQIINLKDASSREEVKRLLKLAHIVITNFPSDKARRFGLDYASIQSINPAIILANISGFGDQTDRPAFDVLVQAESGFMAMTGFPDRSPVRFPLPIVDILSGHQLKQAILCALLKKVQTGQGSEVKVSLYDSALSALTNVGSNYLMGKIITHPAGTQHPSIAPYGDIYETKDGQMLILAIGSDTQFARLVEVLGPLDLDVNVKKNSERVLHREKLNSILQRKFIQQSMTYWLQHFHRNNIPAGAVKTIDQVLSDNHAHKNILEEPLSNGITSKRTRQVVFI